MEKMYFVPSITEGRLNINPLPTYGIGVGEYRL